MGIFNRALCSNLIRLAVTLYLLAPYGYSDEDSSIDYERDNLKFESIENVNGTGFTNIRQHMENSETASLSSCRIGSGYYSSSGILRYNSVNESDEEEDLESASEDDGFFDGYPDHDIISMKRGNISTAYARTSLSLPRRDLDFDARWSDVTSGISIESDTSFLDSISYATEINRTANLILDDSDAHIKSDAGFHGTADIRYRSQISSYSERYIGAAQVSRDISSDKSVSSAKGLGFADIERMISKRGVQKTYERGSGSFSREEIIKPEKDYIAMNLTAAYLPVNISAGTNNSQNLAVEWRAGLISQEEDVGQISERFTGLMEIQKSIVISRPISVQTEVNFSGRGEFMISSENITAIEEYTGNYSIRRNATIVVIPRYRKPHVSVTQTVHLDPIGCGIAIYNITVSNDGNKEVGPIDVKDTFPAGTSFIESSAEPTTLKSHYAVWSIDQLQIDESASIELVLEIDKEVEKLTNRVKATAYYLDKEDDVHHTASNHNSTIQVSPDECNIPPIYVSMNAKKDSANASRINYSVTIHNNAASIMNIDLTCELPAGVLLLDTPEKPERIENNNLTWSFYLRPGTKKKICYEVGPKESGLITNRAIFSAKSEDGKEQFAGAANVTVLATKPKNISIERLVGDWLPGDLIESPGTFYGNIPCPCILDPSDIAISPLPDVEWVYLHKGYKPELPCCFEGLSQ